MMVDAPRIARRRGNKESNDMHPDAFRKKKKTSVPLVDGGNSLPAPNYPRAMEKSRKTFTCERNFKSSKSHKKGNHYIMESGDF